MGIPPSMFSEEAIAAAALDSATYAPNPAASVAATATDAAAPAPIPSESVPIGPSKVVRASLSMLVQCKVAYFVLEGLADGSAHSRRRMGGSLYSVAEISLCILPYPLSTPTTYPLSPHLSISYIFSPDAPSLLHIVGEIQPRHIVAVRADCATSGGLQQFIYALRQTTGASRVSTPQVGERIDISTHTSQFRAMLSSALVSGAVFQPSMGGDGCRVAHVDSELVVLQGPTGPPSLILQPLPASILSTRPPRQPHLLWSAAPMATGTGITSATGTAQAAVVGGSSALRIVDVLRKLQKAGIEADLVDGGLATRGSGILVTRALKQQTQQQQSTGDSAVAVAAAGGGWGGGVCVGGATVRRIFCCAGCALRALHNGVDCSIEYIHMYTFG